ncbi:MAG: hypothetical protein Q4G34_07800 [Micrococcus sp.]|nr:hypothetical protein [Micrococcus sp.]
MTERAVQEKEQAKVPGRDRRRRWRAGAGALGAALLLTGCANSAASDVAPEETVITQTVPHKDTGAMCGGVTAARPIYQLQLLIRNDTDQPWPINEVEVQRQENVSLAYGVIPTVGHVPADLETVEGSYLSGGLATGDLAASVADAVDGEVPAHGVARVLVRGTVQDNAQLSGFSGVRVTYTDATGTEQSLQHEGVVWAASTDMSEDSCVAPPATID